MTHRIELYVVQEGEQNASTRKRREFTLMQEVQITFLTTVD